MSQQNAQSEDRFTLPFGGSSRIVQEASAEQEKLADEFEWRDTPAELRNEDPPTVPPPDEFGSKSVVVFDGRLQGLSPSPTEKATEADDLTSVAISRKSAWPRQVARMAALFLALIVIPSQLREASLPGGEYTAFVAELAPRVSRDAYVGPISVPLIDARMGTDIGQSVTVFTQELPDLREIFREIRTVDNEVASTRRDIGMGYFGTMVTEAQVPVSVSLTELPQPPVAPFPINPTAVAGERLAFQEPFTIPVVERTVPPAKFNHPPFAQVLIPTVLETNDELL